VSEAFAEDPVRILRVGRFAARFNFKVADDTMALMQRMVGAGEADYLVPERVWQEFSKGLAEEHPEKMFQVLEQSGLLRKILSELRGIPNGLSGTLPVRFAWLSFALEESEIDALCQRLRVPNEVRELALLARRSRDGLRAVGSAPAKDLLELLKRADALRRPERFAELLEVGRLAEGIDPSRAQRALQAAKEVDAGAVAGKAPSPGEIPRLIDEARLTAIWKKLDQLPE
jgi:tRNA nucleotidyltransferase (CCA-adding enzyme)